MAFTVREIMTLPSLSKFNLVAGKGGLNNYIITAGIVDYEFVEGLDYDLSKAFEKDSIVISSLLFAKDKPELILPAIKFLKKSGVGAFAYKQILFETLPEDVIAYADKNDFPIFSFRDGAWFENIIFEVMAAVEKDDARYLSEAHIEKMIKGEATQEEVDNIRRGVSLLIDRAVSAGYVKMPELDANRVLRSFYMSKNLKEKVLVSKYEEGIFVLITTSS
ncbi:MAG: PucR family transcriptional regulator ligand-binding domain-containing protein [Firmicutes bacterium]|nr:PucR family transcriptional regulator ligand-binding domain-containing protein [Bacillota bacterium]